LLYLLLGVFNGDRGLIVHKGLSGNLLNEPRSSIFIPFVVFFYSWSSGVGKISTQLSAWQCYKLPIVYKFSYFLYNIVELMSGLKLFQRDNLYMLFIWEPVGASMRLVHPRTWFKPPVTICFAMDRCKGYLVMFSFSLIVGSTLKLVI
jgi:hypothetical protein